MNGDTEKLHEKNSCYEKLHPFLPSDTLATSVARNSSENSGKKIHLQVE